MNPQLPTSDLPGVAQVFVVFPSTSTSSSGGGAGSLAPSGAVVTVAGLSTRSAESAPPKWSPVRLVVVVGEGGLAHCSLVR